MPTNRSKRDEILRNRFEHSGNYDVNQVGGATYYLPRTRTPIQQPTQKNRTQTASNRPRQTKTQQAQQHKRSSPGFSAPSVAGRDYRKLFGVDIDPNWSAEDKVRAAGWNREHGFMDDAAYEAFVQEVQQQNTIQGELDAQELANRGRVQAARERATTRGQQDRKTLQQEQEFQRNLMEDFGLTPSGYDAPGTGGGQGGLKPNQLWDAWADFSESYDMQNLPTGGLKNPEDERAYEIEKQNAFKEQMDSLGLIGRSTGRGRTTSGSGSSGSTGRSVQARLESLMNGGGEDGTGQKRPSQTGRNLVEPRIMRDKEGGILITNNPERLDNEASRGSRAQKPSNSASQNKQQGVQTAGQNQQAAQDDQAQGNQQSSPNASNQQQNSQASTSSQGGTSQEQSREGGHPGVATQTNQAMSAMAQRGPTSAPSQDRATGRQEVGFFSGLGEAGSPGEQYRRNVMQGWVDQAMQGVQDIPQAAAQAPGRIAGAFSGRNPQDRRGTGRDPIGSSLSQSYMDTVNAPDQRQEIAANMRSSIEQSPAGQIGEGVSGAFDSLTNAVAESYMSAVEAQGNRPNITPDQLPNLTANMIQGVANGSRDAMAMFEDVMGRVAGNAKQAPDAAQEFIQRLTQIAKQAGIDLKNATTEEIQQLIQSMFGKALPELFQRQSNMQGPATWGSNTMPTPTSGPRSALSRANIGVPSLHEFDAE